MECLNFANKYELTTLFEQCEQALVEKIDIHSCTILHDKAAKLDAKALSRSCNQFFASFTDSLRGMVTVSISNAKLHANNFFARVSIARQIHLLSMETLHTI